jgi:hypothetical protein
MKFFMLLALLVSFQSQAATCRFDRERTLVVEKEFEASSSYFVGIGSDTSCEKAFKKCNRDGYQNCRVVGGTSNTILEGALEGGSCRVKGQKTEVRKLSTKEFCGELNSCLISMLGEDSDIQAAKIELATALFDRNKCHRHLD